MPPVVLRDLAAAYHEPVDGAERELEGSGGPPGQTSVLVVGAGPTGLVLALWLARLGVRARIIDRSAAPPVSSRALGVHARTLELYRQLGFADAAVARGIRVQAVNLWAQGRRAARVVVGPAGAPLTPYPFILDFSQDAHERLLTEQLRAAGVEVERETELVGLTQDRGTGTVRVALRGPAGHEETCAPVYVAGCDGAHSAVRTALGVGFSGGTYAQLFYVADVTATGGAAADGEVHIDLDATDLLAIFPMAGGHVRLVGTVDAERAEGRALAFADVSHRIIGQMGLTIGAVNWFSTYRVHHRVADRFREGRVFLLGDAAHIHSPVGAQGMNTGIGDAVNLAWKLAAVVRGSATPALLDSFQPERIGFARRLVATTDRVFTMATRPSALAALVRTRAVPAVLPPLAHLGVVRRLLFRTVSQLGIAYRASPLSAGRAGALHGGDRLPWVPALPGPTVAPGDGADTDNFAPLTSLEWQVHVYGDPPSGLADACAALRLPHAVFPWQPAMAGAGFARGALYLVRPDGYIALADPRGDPRQLGSYFTARGLMRGSLPPAARRPTA